VKINVVTLVIGCLLYTLRLDGKAAWPGSRCKVIYSPTPEVGKIQASGLTACTRIHETIATLADSNVDQQFTSQGDANMVMDADVATWASWV